MITPVKDIDFTNYTEAIPAFLTLIFMPLTYSIADGIMVGMLSWIFLKLLTGNFKFINVMTIIVGVLFLLKLIVG